MDQDLLVDAPLPERATVGDELILPIRLSNRTDTARAVSVQVTGTDSLGIIPVTIEAVQIPPLDTIELPFPITFTKAAMGKVTIAAVDDRNRPVDAVRRRIDIQPGLRKAKTEVGEILRGRGTLTVDAPKGADLTVHLTVGSSLFAGYETVSWTEWLNSLVGRPVHTTDERDDYDLFAFEDDEDRGVRAMLIGAKWSDREIPDSAVSRVIARLFDEVNKESKERANDVRFSSRLLMLLAPAYLHRDKRPALSAPLAKLIRALRVDVENGAAQFADAPWLCARAAAALLWTLRRARESVVRIDGELWFEGGRDDSFALESELFGVSALFALAEFRAGNEGFAFELIRGMAKRAHFESEGMTGADDLEVEDRIMAQAAAALLTGERPESSFKLLIDGHRYDVELEEGYGNIEPSAFEHGGTHAVEIKDAGSRPILVEAKAKYQADWNTPPKHVGPFALRLDGEAGRADGRSGFELSVRNRNPRVISEPVVEIYLPAGAEVDEEARERLTELTGFQPSVSSDTLTLRLRPMRPREERIISLPWLWTVGGRMTGIGITAWAADRPEAICVLPAKKIEVQRRASTIGGNP